MITVLSYAERGQLVWEQHQDVLDAIVNGDAERAVALVTDHINGAEVALLGAISELPDQPDV